MGGPSPRHQERKHIWLASEKCRVQGHDGQSQGDLILESMGARWSADKPWMLSRSACPLTALSSHPSRGYILVTRDQEPITFGQDTVDEDTVVGICSPPQGFNEILPQPLKCQDYSIHSHT